MKPSGDRQPVSKQPETGVRPRRPETGLSTRWPRLLFVLWLAWMLALIYMSRGEWRRARPQPAQEEELIQRRGPSAAEPQSNR